MSLDLSPGVRIRGRYEIQKPLGKGGFGRAYQAEDIYRREPVVIKAIPLGRESRWSVLAPWEDEISKLRRASYRGLPSIVDQFSFDEGMEAYYVLVQQFIPLPSLKEQVSQKGPLSGDKVREMVKSLLGILDYLEKSGLSHGAIKPSTILLSSEGTVTLVDLGLLQRMSWALGGEGPDAQTRLYSSPQYGSEKVPAISQDIYSLGISLFFALTGNLPPGAGSSVISLEDLLGPDHPWKSFLKAALGRYQTVSLGELEALVPDDFSQSSAVPSGASREDVPEEKPWGENQRESEQPTSSFSQGEWDGGSKEDFEKLPGFVKNILKAVKPPTSVDIGPLPPFSTLRDELSKTFSLTPGDTGWNLMLPKNGGKAFGGAIFLAFGLFFLFMFGSLAEELLNDGDFIFILFFLFPILFPVIGLVMLIGEGHMQLRSDRIIKYVKVFNMVFSRKEIPLEDIQSIEVDVVRGSKGSVSYYLGIRTKSQGNVRFGGVGGLGKEREDLRRLVTAWWQEMR